MALPRRDDLGAAAIEAGRDDAALSPVIAAAGCRGRFHGGLAVGEAARLLWRVGVGSAGLEGEWRFFRRSAPRADSPVRKGLPDFSFGVGVAGETVSGAGLDVSLTAPGTTAGVVSVAGTGVVPPGRDYPVHRGLEQR